MLRSIHVTTLAAALVVAGAAGAQQETPAQSTPPTNPDSEMTAAKKRALIKSALAAAPEAVAEHAAVIVIGGDGQMVQLREGTNGFTCMPDQPASPGTDPMCLDEPGMEWAHSWMSHAERPANTQPGIGYMLAGGSDVSADDPWATTTEHFVSSPPHWMLLWPVDAKASGLSTKPKKTGTWIMWAGTPYAHLMINQQS